MKPFAFCSEVHRKPTWICFCFLFHLFFAHISSSFLGNFSSRKYFNENKSFFWEFRWMLVVGQMKRGLLVSVQSKSENWLRVLQVIWIWPTGFSSLRLSAFSQRQKGTTNARETRTHTDRDMRSIPHNFPKPNAPLDFTKLFRDFNIINPKGFKLGRESFSRCKILI